jgi:hypothetical protein
MVRTRARASNQRGGYIEYTEEEKHPLIYDGFIEYNEIEELEDLNAPPEQVAKMVSDEIPTAEILAHFRANPVTNSSQATRIAAQAFTFEEPSLTLTLQNPQEPESTRLNMDDFESPRSVAKPNWGSPSRGGKRRKSINSKKVKKSKKTRKSNKSKKTRKSKKSRKHRGGNSPETAGVMPSEEDEFFQQQNQTNYIR